MALNPLQHKFNDDLLLRAEDCNRARDLYGTIFHVLDHPELRRLFYEYDVPANEAKRRSLRAGILAILCGFFALAIAAAEILAGHAEDVAVGPTPANSFPIGHALAVASGLCAMTSFTVGTVGILFARRKREWLHCRLMGETLRQFHFWEFVVCLPKILASLADGDGPSKFCADRKQRLQRLKRRLVGRLDSAFTALIDSEEGNNLLLQEFPESEVDLPEDSALDPLFKAYRELRILHQIDYCDYKLGDDGRLLSKLPRRQSLTFAAANVVWIVLLVALHGGILAGILFPGSALHVFDSGRAAVFIIWIALAALATRAIEGGLQPEREIERYQQYRSTVRAILERFDLALTQKHKIDVMREMERASFDEMQNFLITNNRSRFVM